MIFLSFIIILHAMLTRDKKQNVNNGRLLNAARESNFKKCVYAHQERRTAPVTSTRPKFVTSSCSFSPSAIDFRLALTDSLFESATYKRRRCRRMNQAGYDLHA